MCRGSTELENSHQSLQVERPLQAIPESAEAPSGTLSNSRTPVRAQRKRSTPSNVASIEGSPDVSVLIKHRNISKTTVITPRRKKAVENDENDFVKIQEQLENEQVFSDKGNHQHYGFKKHKPSGVTKPGSTRAWARCHRDACFPGYCVSRTHIPRDACFPAHISLGMRVSHQ